MASHNNLGKAGEIQAEAYLKNKGYVVLERNWQSSHKEIDIIAFHNGWLVIAEVKTRTAERWERPEQAINRTKIKNLVKAAHHYVCIKCIDHPVRFDVLSVTLKNGDWSIEHFEDAFLAPHK